LAETDERELAELLAGMWREVLRAPELDTESHFFRSGGSSLQAAVLVARVRSRTGAALTLQQVFRAPTPTLLARRLRGGR
jgi:aryl carrier-like protein